MELDVESARAGYINRLPAHGRAVSRGRFETRSGRHATGRAVDRMLLALRAHEQRAQRRAALRAWLIARRAAINATDSRGRIATSETAHG
jgi:hypothetical protein